jgi:hypothetical protein
MLAQERYHLVCLKTALSAPGIQALLQLLKTPEWQQEVARIEGYSPVQSGEVLSMRKVLPWWDFAARKRGATGAGAIEARS